MNGESLKKLRIFAASPSDVATERAKLETVVMLLRPITDYLGLTLEVMDWRSVVPDAGRPQQIIFNQLKPTSWDIFIGILWHRFGTPPGAKDPQTQKDYLSGTEEEFRTAYRLQKQFGKPRIVMYRCTRPIPIEVDFVQAQRIKDFFKEIQDPQNDFHVLTQSFDTLESFEKLWLDNLQRLLIEYAEQSKTPITPEVAQVLVPTIPNNLPNRAAFFGRAKEMEIVMSAISPTDRTWGILVDGIGGIGKSSLAVEAAHRAQETGTFDAFVYVSAKQNILEPSGIREQTPAVLTLEEFLNETARVLGQIGIAKLVSDEKRRALLDVLHGTRTLLIYDNLETLSKEEQEAMADFLRELPQGCKAIVTSRWRGGEGAVWLRLGKMDWDAARSIIENEISRDVGLANKLRRVESRWQELYDETNGSPLALVHTLGLMRVRATLAFDNALAMLQGNRDADLQKFIFQEARKELAPNDKAALGALSFFMLSATFEAWMQVANLSRNALETTIDRLNALSLVDIFAGEERYTLHPLTRAFVRDELLTDANIAYKTGLHFAKYWVDYAKRYGGSGDESYKTYSRLEIEWTNLEGAMEWLQGTIGVQDSIIYQEETVPMLVDLGNAISMFLSFSGRWEQQLHFYSWLYDLARSTNNFIDMGWSAYNIAWINLDRGNTSSAAFWAEQCADAYSHTASKNRKADAIRMLGLVAWQRDQYIEAERLLQESLRMWRQSGNAKKIARILNEIGKLQFERQDYIGAERYFQQALTLVELKWGRFRRIVYIGNLGMLALERQQWSKARQYYEQQLALAREVGRIESVAHAQYGLARVEEAEGHVDLALLLAQEALKIYGRLQHRDLTVARELVERLEKNIEAEE